MPVVISPDLTSAGILYTADANELVARGLIQGAMAFDGYGERVSIGAETNQPIVPNGMIIVPHATGVQMSVVSTSENDAAAGTGVQQLEIHYNDGGNNLTSEIVTMNGMTPVLTVATDIRFIQCMHIHRSGSGTRAAGDITATNGGTVYSVVLTGETRCSSTFRMVPHGKRLFVLGGVISSTSATSDAISKIRMAASELDNHQYLDPLVLIPFIKLGAVNTGYAFTFPVPRVFNAWTVVGATHSTDKAATVGCTWFGRLEGAP